ncbi:MAG: hypothetical protein K8R79_08870 [Calditrichales bacterium]|nr:hypothetical protein [Calditrichales bacterium]
MKDRQIEIKLTVKSAEVTEAWLKLETSPLESEAVYIVKRDTQFVFNSKLDKSDTLLHDKNLLPAHEYNYSAYAILNGKTGKIVKASVTTMDTTSHDFEWEVFEFGAKSSSVLHDVAIISPEDIWAVGEIHTEDTDCWNEDSTEWIKPYNAVHWDGEKWELKRIETLYRPDYKISPPLEGIFAFSNDDIWISSGSPWHWNGSKWKFYHLWDMGVLNENDGGVPRMWGTSSEDMYFSGRKGTIVHYDGQSWQKIESGTDLHIYDIYGIDNQSEGSSEIYCVAAKHLESYDKEILQINGLEVNILPNEGIPWAIKGILFKPGIRYYVAGSGIYTKRDIHSNKPWKAIHHGVTNYHLEGIRGNDINDFILCGHFGEILHFNGMTWKSYRETVNIKNTIFYEAAVKDDIIAAVGSNPPNAVIVFGRR